jgi:4-amino-4-deoxy-L-arabinose transferase-like glycosyltransferase
MERAIKYFLVAVITASFAGKVVLALLNQGLWWDEAVYLGLGRGIMSGSYSLDPQAPLETFRPPAFPFLISPLSESILAARLAVIAISAFSVAFTYYAGKRIFGKEPALWASLFLSTSYLFIFFSGKVLSEPLFLAFLSLSLLFLARWVKDKKPGNAFLAGAFAGLCFITRYLGNLLILSYGILFIVLLLRRDKGTSSGFLSFLAGSIIPIIPWLMISVAYYGSPLASFFINSAITFEFPSWDFLAAGYDILYALGLALPFFIIGFALLAGKKHIRREPVFLLLLLSVVSVFAYLALPYRESRYLLSFYPVYAIVAGFGMHEVTRFRALRRIRVPIQIAVILASILFISWAFFAGWNDSRAAICLEHSSLEIRNLTAPGEKVMTESYPYVIYLSERQAMKPPRNETGFIPALEQNGIRLILVYKFEPKNPEYLANLSLSERFRKLQTFKEWNDPEACTIYEFA